jgi:hypothetical protein
MVPLGFGQNSLHLKNRPELSSRIGQRKKCTDYYLDGPEPSILGAFFDSFVDEACRGPTAFGRGTNSGPFGLAADNGGYL